MRAVTRRMVPRLPLLAVGNSTRTHSAVPYVVTPSTLSSLQIIFPHDCAFILTGNLWMEAVPHQSPQTLAVKRRNLFKPARATLFAPMGLNVHKLRTDYQLIVAATEGSAFGSFVTGRSSAQGQFNAMSWCWAPHMQEVHFSEDTEACRPAAVDEAIALCHVHNASLEFAGRVENEACLVHVRVGRLGGYVRFSMPEKPE